MTKPPDRKNFELDLPPPEEDDPRRGHFLLSLLGRVAATHRRQSDELHSHGEVDLDRELAVIEARLAAEDTRSLVTAVTSTPCLDALQPLLGLSPGLDEDEVSRTAKEWLSINAETVTLMLQACDVICDDCRGVENALLSQYSQRVFDLKRSLIDSIIYR